MRYRLRLAALTVLIAGLLSALLLGMNSETGIRLRDKLTDLLLSGKLVQPLVNVPPVPDPAAAPTRHTDNVPAEAEPQIAEAQDTATEPVPGAGPLSGLEADLSENGLRVEHLEDAEPQIAEAQDTATEPAPGAGPLSGLEADLTENGLRVERLEDDGLKVNLSNEGIFDFNSTEISDKASTELKTLVDVLLRHAGTRIRVVGHTDSSGDPGFNLALSQVRAKVVADYLIGQGLLGEHIRSEGRGDRDTRLESSTRNRPELRRRIEVYISPLQEG
jgi:outer membrane protein OmpA-like peptidoglycan-associated protein